MPTTPSRQSASGSLTSYLSGASLAGLGFLGYETLRFPASLERGGLARAVATAAALIACFVTSRYAARVSSAAGRSALRSGAGVGVVLGAAAILGHTLEVFAALQPPIPALRPQRDDGRAGLRDSKHAGWRIFTPADRAGRRGPCWIGERDDMRPPETGRQADGGGTRGVRAHGARRRSDGTSIRVIPRAFREASVRDARVARARGGPDVSGAAPRCDAGSQGTPRHAVERVSPGIDPALRQTASDRPGRASRRRCAIRSSAGADRSL
jgi:hypothetical protein